MNMWHHFPAYFLQCIAYFHFSKGNRASNDDMVARISAAMCNALRNSQQQVRVKADG